MMASRSQVLSIVPLGHLWEWISSSELSSAGGTIAALLSHSPIRR